MRERAASAAALSTRGGPAAQFIRKMVRTINTVEKYFLYAVINS